MDASKAASIGADAVVRKAIALLKSRPYSLVNGYLQGVPIHMEERSRRRVGMPSWMARCSVPRVGLPSAGGGRIDCLSAAAQYPPGRRRPRNRPPAHGPSSILRPLRDEIRSVA